MVEGRYSALFKLEHVPPAFIADGLARYRFVTPRSPWSSQTRGSSPKSGPTGSWRLLFRMPRAVIRLLSEGDRGFGPLQVSSRPL